jgi:enoyl-CoA hydratase
MRSEGKTDEALAICAALENARAVYTAARGAAYAPATTAMFTAVTGDVILHREERLGHVTLNRPAALNALTHEMCASIFAALQEWAQDASVHAVLIDAVAGRAFCAGGDIRAITQLGREDMAKAEAFFATEYRLNAAVRHYAKPYVALLNGITMGGGAGVSVHGSHRIVSENASFAMPETGIGLYPDIGATWFLSRLPGETGTWLGLTGTRIGPADMLWLGLGTHFVPAADMAQIASGLASGEPADAAIAAVAQPAIEPPQFAAYRDEIDRAFAADSVEEILARLRVGSTWARAVAATIETRSPTSLKLTFRALREARKLDFDGCMRMEYRLTLRVLRGHDLYEGVRALLIDRDQRPRWLPDSLALVTDQAIDAYFAPLEGQELVLSLR